MRECLATTRMTRRRQRRRVQQRRGILAMVLLIGLLSLLTALIDPFQARPAASSSSPAPAPVTTRTEQRWIAVTGTATGARTRPATPPAPAPSQAAKGTFHVLPVAGRPTSRPGRAITYAVFIEDGVALDEKQVGATIASALTDARGWEVKDKVRFVQLTGPGAEKADLRIMLASPGTTAAMCAPLATHGEVSCQPGGSNRAILNLRRWLLGVPGYRGDLASYRAMVTNHEVGHFLGHSHVSCPGPGRPAPVMQQQTLDLQGCTPNPWPTVA